MGIPTFLALPAARSDRAACTSCHPLDHMLLWTALLFLGLPKAVVNIQPAWINVLKEDYVTLMCQATNLCEGNLTLWFHNGSFIQSQNQSSYSFKASSNDSGDYRCQREQTSLSDPVHLYVTSGPAILLIFPPWYQITFCLVMALLFAVDTELYFSVQRDLQSSAGDWKNCKVRWSQGPQDK
ncbi:low affinity immunoglobulin gamma Fc region receptor II-like isoform X2 [Neophocaena asiaeorientalis asiaeorientalis]|uniref:low affinity immunoglobulin gamma Fc region receptor II-like isoform X2 n=1 Tax=Neophocaena asiaeorientalis asiaeorientalis TaxID=1706337 RepID=UPI000D1F5B82|nr:low affinity immunoglobulin gamma Fc region receptor II-like isoform X2 [Neophocaena asiaeorientalis asiaeorientalis]